MTEKSRFVEISDYYRKIPFGYFLSREKAEDAITSFELATADKFVTTRSRDHKFPEKKQYKVWWDLKAFNSNIKDFDGIPFTIERVQKRECQHGPDRMRKLGKMSKKKNGSGRIMPACPACVHLREVAKYPQFKIVGKRTKAKCEYQSKKLRDCLRMYKSSIQVQTRWYVDFPSRSSHKHHQSGENFHFMIKLKDPVAEKLEEFCQEDPNQSFRVLHERLENYVTNVLFYQNKPPSKTDRAYFPIQRDIKNFVFLRNLDSQSYVFDGLPNYRPRPILIDIDAGPIVDGDVEGDEDLEIITPPTSPITFEEKEFGELQQIDATVQENDEQQPEILQLPNEWFETVTVADEHSNDAVGMVDTSHNQQTYLVGEGFELEQGTQLVDAHENDELVDLDYGALINSNGLVDEAQYHTHDDGVTFHVIGLNSQEVHHINQPMESQTMVLTEDELNSFASQLTPEQLNNLGIQLEADDSSNNVTMMNDAGNSITEYFTIVGNNGEQVVATHFEEQEQPGCSGSSVF